MKGKSFSCIYPFTVGGIKQFPRESKSKTITKNKLGHIKVFIPINFCVGHKCVPNTDETFSI